MTTEALNKLSHDSLDALDAAAQRINGTSFEGLVERCRCSRWRPDPRCHDGALLLVALEFLDIKPALKAQGRTAP